MGKSKHKDKDRKKAEGSGVALRDRVEGWTLVWAVLAGAAFIGAIAALKLPANSRQS